jgi:hypothetical protein
MLCQVEQGEMCQDIRCSWDSFFAPLLFYLGPGMSSR